MRTGISFTVSAADRTRLEAVIFHPSSPQKHVWRCRIVLLSADGLGTAAIMASTGKSKTCVWRWQERFMREGADGLLREKTRPPGIARTTDGKVADVKVATIAASVLAGRNAIFCAGNPATKKAFHASQASPEVSQPSVTDRPA